MDRPQSKFKGSENMKNEDIVLCLSNIVVETAWERSSTYMGAFYIEYKENLRGQKEGHKRAAPLST